MITHHASRGIDACGGLGDLDLQRAHVGKALAGVACDAPAQAIDDILISAFRNAERDAGQHVRKRRKDRNPE